MHSGKLMVCWSSKGGSGTSVTASALAIAAARCPEATKTLIVDLDGDIPAILGLDEPAIGLAEWMTLPTAFTIDELLIESSTGLLVLPRGAGALPERRSPSWSVLARALNDRVECSWTVIVDGGSSPIPHELAAVVARHFLVVRPCYLALRRARQVDCTLDGVIVVEEPNRVLTAADIESVVGVPISATLSFAADIARRVDAGVIANRPPRDLIEALSPLVRSPSDS